MKNLNKMKIAPDMQYEIGQDKVGYFPEWSVKDDATLYKKVNKLAHSTFDRSKFTVVGSPNITDDGIASGFSSSNYITVASVTANNSIVITSPVVYPNAVQEGYVCFSANADGKLGFQFNFKSNGKLKIAIQRFRDVVLASTEVAYSIDNYYQAKLEITSSTVKGFLSVNGGVWTQVCSGTNTNETLVVNTISLGRYPYATAPFTAGSIDLKQFSITVDGVEVFSGNKTGIDTIKPTNFTVNTTMYCFKQSTNTIYANSSSAPTELYNADGTTHPQSASEWQIVTTTVDNVTTYDVQYNGNSATYTSGSNITASTVNSPMINPPLPWDAGVKITKDGIASGFSTTNSLTTGFKASNLLGKSWKIKVPIKGNGGTFGVPIRFTAAGSNPTQGSSIMCRYADKNFYAQLKTGDSSENVQNVDKMQIDISSYYNTPCFVILSFDISTGTYTLKLENTSGTVLNSKTFTPTTTNKQLYEITSTNNYIGIGGVYGTQVNVNATHNLNAFKIYVDGNLAYQPCLKIPYTEGQNYVKVVDKLYRDRVKDLFEQKGYNIYYTLGEDDFTLPSNKPNDIVKYKADGLTVAEQRADQTLTIRGACESGVDVNLPMKFFDGSSYAVFGVGTTGTNTASKFTPAADGNYIAIGKGKV